MTRRNIENVNYTERHPVSIRVQFYNVRYFWLSERLRLSTSSEPLGGDPEPPHVITKKRVQENRRVAFLMPESEQPAHILGLKFHPVRRGLLLSYL